MKTYRTNWEPCKMMVNFNQKQWRQDIASFIVNKLNWNNSRVSRSKQVDDYKEFEIFELFSKEEDSFKIKYTNKNDIISSSNTEIVNEYLSLKGIRNNE